jgi:Ca-activated chloride channel family protein
MGYCNRGHLAAPALAALLAALSAGPARAQEPAAVTIILDASGSMWNNIEGSKGSKINLAREAVRRALPKLPPQTKVGLAAFGHRRGDCVDVELIRAPEPIDAPRMSEQMEKVNPRGRGPLVHALREAAKPLLPLPGKRSLLLIHDEADNCQQNVCVVADELRRAGLATHVVGLGLKPDDMGKMACLPQATGGRLVNVQTPEQVTAAVEELLRLAVGDAGAGARPGPVTGPVPAPSAAARPAPSPSAGAAPMPPANAPPGLYLRPLLVAKGEPVSAPMNWMVTPEGQPGTVLFARRASYPDVPLPPGRYLVEARDGPVSASETVTVADKGPTVVSLVLNAGVLQACAQAAKGNAPFGDAVITITDTKESGVGTPVAVFKGSEATAMLPAGRYLVRVEQGLARAERAVVVTAGGQGRIDIPIDAARLQLSAAGRDFAGTGDTLTFSIAEDDPDAPKGRREVARAAGRQAEFVLPPGTYYVIAKLGIIEARDSIAVGPGDVVKRTLSVAAGRLTLATKPVGGGQASSEPVSYRIERLDAPADVIVTSRPSPAFLLPAGRYRVEGRYGAMNARAVRDVEVKAGQAQQLTLEHQAAALKLRLVGSGGPVLADVAWDIRDEAGATVWTTAQAEPSLVLQSGRYVVRAETRDKRYSRALEVKAGDSRVLELPAD